MLEGGIILSLFSCMIFLRICIIIKSACDKYITLSATVTLDRTFFNICKRNQHSETVSEKISQDTHIHRPIES